MIRRHTTRAAYLTTPPRFLLKHTKVQLEGHHCQPDVQTSNQPRILWASRFFPGNIITLEKRFYKYRFILQYIYICMCTYMYFNGNWNINISYFLSLNLKFNPSVFVGRCQSQHLELCPMTVSSPRLPASVATICPWLECLRQLVEQHPRA